MFFKKFSLAKVKTDQELLQLYRSTEDLGYLGDLYSRYSHLVLGVCLKYLQNTDDSQDAAMQVFEKLIVDLKKYNVEHFPTWLHTVSKNYCLSILRSRKNPMDQSSIENLENRMELSYQLHLENEDLEVNLQLLERAIEELNEEQKLCIRLFYLEEKSYKEISQTTGLDLLKVKSSIQNGKRMLKIYLEKNAQNETR